MHPVFGLVETCIIKSGQSLLCAEAGDWEQLIILDADRQKLMRRIKLKELVLSEEHQVKLQERMDVLIGINAEIESHCQQQRLALVSEFQKIKQGNKALKAYS